MGEMKPQLYKDPRPAEYFQRRRKIRFMANSQLFGPRNAPHLRRGGRSRSQQLGEPKPGIGQMDSERTRQPLSFPVEQAPSRERQLEVASETFGHVRQLYEGDKQTAV
jgi:hypothetical protein